MYRMSVQDPRKQWWLDRMSFPRIYFPIHPTLEPRILRNTLDETSVSESAASLLLLLPRNSESVQSLVTAPSHPGAVPLKFRGQITRCRGSIVLMRYCIICSIGISWLPIRTSLRYRFKIRRTGWCIDVPSHFVSGFNPTRSALDTVQWSRSFHVAFQLR